MEAKALPTQSSAANIAATRALQNRNAFPSVAVPTLGEINRNSMRARMESSLMEENANGSTGNGVVEIPRLRELAEFRFQLRQFLSFSEISSERHGVQAQQYQLLQVIAAAPAGQPASVSYLADRMVLRHNSTVELVDRAERAGLVRRHTDERDLRRSIIKLTPLGEQMLRAMVAEHVQELERLSERIVHSLRAVAATGQMPGTSAPDQVGTA
jgi:DNA-binding MarR family transcriptional regulator